jgi:hypothetical protein
MSRFGASGTFYYASGDTLTSLATIYLDAGQLPQYAFDNQTITDRVTYRSKSGKSWMYENYNLDAFTFKWSLLDESKRNSLRTMYDSKPILTFHSNGTCFGTFRFAEATWSDSEAAYELYDISFTLEETT